MTQSDKILPGTAETFRKLWRGFGSGVTLIATELDGEPCAMVATAAISVSMEPPSLLISVNREASSYAALCERGAFSLGILSAEDGAIGASIARAPTAERLLHGTWNRLAGTNGPENGLPWLAESLATLFCVTDKVVDYGSHRLFIAKVACAVGDSRPTPLLYCDGQFGRLQALSQ